MQANEGENLKNFVTILCASLSRFCVVACLMAASTWLTIAQTQKINSQQETASSTVQALRLSPEAAQIADEIGVGGGAGSVLLSLVGIHKQSGGRRLLGDSPRMLARFFGRQPAVTEAISSEYPEAVWSYLNSTPPSQSNPAQSNTVTRREELIFKWRSEGRISSDASPNGERRIESLSSNLAQVRKLSISDLDNRVAMLLDVRARVSLMKRGLGEILRGLSTVNANQ